MTKPEIEKQSFPNSLGKKIFVDVDDDDDDVSDGGNEDGEAEDEVPVLAGNSPGIVAFKKFSKNKSCERNFDPSMFSFASLPITVHGIVRPFQKSSYPSLRKFRVNPSRNLEIFSAFVPPRGASSFLFRLSVLP